MRLGSILLVLVAAMHTSARYIDESREIKEGRDSTAPEPHIRRDTNTTPQAMNTELLEERSLPKGLPNFADIVLSIVEGIVEDLVGLIDEEDRECAFVGQLTQKFFLKYRDLNVIVYNGKQNIKGLKGSDTSCSGTNFDILAGIITKGYTVCAFNTGSFSRSGDGGCRNWGIAGCYKRTGDGGKDVTFGKRKKCPKGYKGGN